MGSRVSPRHYKHKKKNSPPGAWAFSPKILNFFLSSLSLLGKPFYYIITIVLVSIYLLLTGIGQFVINIPIFISSKLFSFPKKFKRKPKRKRKKPQAKFLFPHLPHLPRFPHLRYPSFLFRPLLIFASALTISLITWAILLRDLPKPEVLATRDQIVSTKIYDRNGKLLYKIFRNQNRTLVPLSQIPQVVRQATIAIEDSDFYSHPGFSIRGITRAFYKNATRGELTGGSTITQQLIKNTLLSSEKTFIRKIKELVLATQVEMNFSKDQILEMYLNEVGYGGAAYGIEEASQLYFGKHVQELDLAEASLLAGLPKAPTTYSPFGTNPNLAQSRQLEVLTKMVEQGYVNPKEAEKAIEKTLKYAPQQQDINAPHFVMYVKQLLVDKYGERVVEEGGLEVTTSLDLDIQEQVQKIVAEETSKIARLRISNGAALVTNPPTGEILAMVGSKDYFDQKADGNYNVTTALRQPGSSIKPVNYSYALEHNVYTASSIIQDTPVTYNVAGSPPYTPRNYDNQFRGNIPLRTALASSLNVPAVKVLATYGVKNMIDQGAKMGITTWDDPKRFGLSLTLGGGEVKMVDMNVVYGVFANKGVRTNLKPILKVVNYRGKTLEEDFCQDNKGDKATELIKDQSRLSQLTLFTQLTHLLIPTVQAAEVARANDCQIQALDPKVSFIITNILSDNNARSPVFGSHSLLVIPNHPEVAVKTGTTQNLRDNWAIGYTKDYVVSAWVGNNDNTPMGYVASGITGATPVWHKIMAFLVENTSSTAWEEPEGLIKVKICTKTSTLPCEGCPGIKEEYYLPGTEPKQACFLKEATPEGQAL